MSLILNPYSQENMASTASLHVYPGVVDIMNSADPELQSMITQGKLDLDNIKAAEMYGDHLLIQFENFIVSSGLATKSIASILSAVGAMKRIPVVRCRDGRLYFAEKSISGDKLFVVREQSEAGLLSKSEVFSLNGSSFMTIEADTSCRQDKF